MINNNYENLLIQIEELKLNATSFFGEKENSKAGRRLRGNAQICINLLKNLRKDVSIVKTRRISEKQNIKQNVSK